MITGVGIFVGLVAGVFVQVSANVVALRWQRNYARDVLLCEVEMNLHEIEILKTRIEKFKQQIAAQQANSAELLINMIDFDYSALTPPITSGHFHKALGSDGVKKYLSASRFFNSQNALHLNQALHRHHAENNSLAFIDWVAKRIEEEEQKFGDVKTLLQRN